METSSRPNGLVAIAFAATACLLCLLFASTAQAYVDPPVKLGAESPNLAGSAEFLVENSPREIVGVEPSMTSEEWYKAEFDTSSDMDAATSAELQSEIDGMLTKTSVWRWALVPELTVGLAGGWEGWEIGSVIYGEFFGESSEPETEVNTPIFADKWYPASPEQWVLSDGSGEIYPPSYGLVSANFGTITHTKECQWELFGDGVPLYAPGWIEWGGCTSEYRDYVLFKPLNVQKCGTTATCTGIEPVPYTGENQPWAPTAEDLQEKIEEELMGINYPVFNRFLDHEIEPEFYPDPRIIKKEVDDKERRCDRGTPAFENPGGNVSPEPFAKKEESAFSVTTRPEGYEAPPVYLRWGTTYWKPGREGFEGTRFLDDWGGWGWRHIIAKHGWSALDREETEVALDIGTPQPTAKEGKYVYEAPDVEPGSGGVECIRKVVVDFETGEEDPAPRGIVTSYNVVK